MVSDNLIVSELDDKSIEHGFLSKKSRFELAQGTHAIIVRYKDVFEDLDFAQDRVVESKNFVVKFTVTDEKSLKLATINIKNLESAQSFANSPELTLEDEHKKPLYIQLQKVDDYKLAKQVDIAVNALSLKQSKEQASTVQKASLANHKPKAHNTLIQVNSLTMLKYWWLKASDEEKKNFKKDLGLAN